MNEFREFGDRLRRWDYPEAVVRVVLETIRIEQENITFKRPPRIIQDIQEAIGRIFVESKGKA